MTRKVLPLKEVSIEELFIGREKCIYEIPIYQRNYAWEKDEISALVQDVYDAYRKDVKKPYYIGTLVSYHKGDQVYEIIDGQQRLTTLKLLLEVLEINPNNRLTYRARKKSDDTLKSIPKFNIEERDGGIVNGYKYAKDAVSDLVPNEELLGFKTFFKCNVHIIHYQVPKDIDLNHYFEIMNSRGEQLEKHEIVKANLMEKLGNAEKEQMVFNHIWECCAEMNAYAQQNLEGVKPEAIFGDSLDDFCCESFADVLDAYESSKKSAEEQEDVTLSGIISSDGKIGWETLNDDFERKDSFLPIIDFPNFLLIVLKLTRMDENSFSPIDFNLDDKELLNEFDNAKMDVEGVRKFAYNLLKARFFLDNFIVHHSKEDDSIVSNPWKLQVWHKDKETKKGQPKNLISDNRLQDKLAHLLSMFEVSFTPKQRKNYLFYCLLYLTKNDWHDANAYVEFVENLADRYFDNVYLDESKLNAINTPIPGSFDEAVLDKRKFSKSSLKTINNQSFVKIYGDGTVASKGIPLFVFNYLDYKLWKLYDMDVRGRVYKEGSKERQEFFDKLGCGDFGLNFFDLFYFSRTRRSLEHYYPQASATGESGNLNQNQINCLGNYAMIGSEANSSGSNWSPKTKLDHYLDSSGKINQISVASLKFMIMMQICKDNQSWNYKEIREHQEKMISVLIGEE